MTKQKKAYRRMDTKITSPRSQYIDQLTWLRGIAAFFVIVSHSINATNVAYVKHDTVDHFLCLTLLNLGSFGVVLFFVLSGCTLYISNASKVGHRYIPQFYIKRFFRIWPPFVMALIIYMLFSLFFRMAYTSPQGYWIEKQFLANYDFFDVLSYLSLTFNITGPEGLFNNAFWSLPVEFQYYLIFPLMIALLRLSGVLGVISLCGLLYFLPKLGFVNYEAPAFFNLAYTFGGGVLIGYIYTKKTFHLSARIGVVLLCSFLLLASAVTNRVFDLPDVVILSNQWNWYGLIGIATVFTCLFSNLNLHGKIKTFLMHYGNISYSTYLYHNVFIGMAVLFSLHFGVHSGGLRLILTFTFTLIATYWAATISYKYIEMPCIKLGRNISKH
ncbi:acyltransferase family protein [Neptunicella sp.]|uniref:acyltransferase family protein n=1 Tax=Neptunicella sp. TaxID=2125986 RepID=UPI003F68FDFB